MDEPRLFTAAELAARLGVAVETVYRMCKTHEWPHSRIGRLYRFTEDHYQAIIATTVAEPRRPRTQRENITRLLASMSRPAEH